MTRPVAGSIGRLPAADQTMRSHSTRTAAPRAESGAVKEARMEFRVLGPLQVVDGERAVALGGPVQRGVLALLVLEANRVVSMRQLVYGLWGDDPPARATGTVQAYVSNLRRALEPDRRPGEPARVLVWRAPGYALQVAPEDVDWLRFERLVEQARQARAAGDLLAADGMFREAGALWRGPALADLTGIAARERARLDGLRLSAVEDHAEVVLALGRHDEVVDDLAAVAAGHPLRERLRGLQMVALYRAGRQVEALDVFTEVRRRLAEGHGLDPGVGLRRLHEQVLRQDPALEAVLPAASCAAHRPGGGPAPFVGRAAELAVLRAHLSVTRAGPGGARGGRAGGRQDPARGGGHHRGRRAGLPGRVGPLRGRWGCAAVVALGAGPPRRWRRPRHRRAGAGAWAPGPAGRPRAAQPGPGRPAGRAGARPAAAAGPRRPAVGRRGVPRGAGVPRRASGRRAHPGAGHLP